MIFKARPTHLAIVTLLILLMLTLTLACSSSDPHAEADVLSDTAPELTAEVIADAVEDSDEREVDTTPARVPHVDSDLQPWELARATTLEATPVTLPDGLRLRVGSFNVYGGQWTTGEAIGHTIGALDLDVVALQECPEALALEIAAAGLYPHVSGSGVVLLSRTPMEDAQIVPLMEGRSFTHALTKVEGVPLSIYGIHLSWNVDGDRQCRELIDEHVTQDPVPNLIMMGDFNDEHHSTQITILEEALTDAFTNLGWYPGQHISWPSHGFDETEGSQLIDLIFTRKGGGAVVIEGGVVETAPLLSDHKPVWADLLLPRDGAPFQADPFAAARGPFAGWPGEGQRPENRLVNPGAEDGVAGWELTGAPRSVAERAHQTPHTGEAFFTGYAAAPSSAVLRSTGAQTVDLSAEAEAIAAGRGALLVSGFLAIGFNVEEGDGIVSNRPEPYDDVEVVVELLDEDGVLVDGWSSGRRDALGWHVFAGQILLPPEVRGARLTWASNRRELGGPSNDGAVDDLYLGFLGLGAPHGRLAGDLLSNPSAEDEGSEAWTSEGWEVMTDGNLSGPWGLSFFPPWAASGERFFVAGGPGVGADGAAMSQAVDLSSFGSVIDDEGLVLRWGGRVRSLHARAGVCLALTILDGDGQDWETIVTRVVRATEWTPLETLTLIPSGASGVRLEIRLEKEDDLGVGFADLLSLRPERAEGLPAPAPCDGDWRLCARGFDQVARLTTHNAMGNEADGFLWPNQLEDLPTQLADGVRGLMLDVHDLEGEPWLCHSNCQVGATRLDAGLSQIRDFLRANPREIVAIIFEDYVPPAVTMGVLEAVGLRAMLHVQPPGAPWPALDDLIARDRRLIVMGDDQDPALPAYLHTWSHAVETHWAAETLEDFSCDPNRGSPDNALFILNHFLTKISGKPELAELANALPFFLERALACREAMGRQPTFVAVDFYSIGDGMEVVRALNGLRELPTP